MLSRYKKNPSLIIYVLLIATLPLFFVRYAGLNGSISLVLLLVIGLVTFLKLFLKGKVINVFGKIEVLVLLYVLGVYLIYLVHLNDSALLPMLKTSLYFLLYLLLKTFFRLHDKEDVYDSTFHGVILGTSVFVFISVYTLVTGGLIASVFDNASYSKTTIHVYRSINEIFGGLADFATDDMKRSAIGEVFSFYALYLILRISRAKSLYILPFYLVNIVNVVLSFSRRSLLTLVISSFFVVLKESKHASSKLILSLLVTISLFILVAFFGGESRLVDLSDTGNIRGSMISAALLGFNDSIFVGNGYGVKIFDDFYVHNIIFSSAFALGSFGFIVSILIVSLLVAGYIKGVVKNDQSRYSYMLLIPILGALVGSTLEGLFTIVSWIIIALWASEQAHSRQT